MDLCQRLPGIVAQLVWRCSKIFSRLLNLFRKYSELLTAITLLYFYPFTLSQEKSHLDTFITFMGAFFGMQNCSEVSLLLKGLNLFYIIGFR